MGSKIDGTNPRALRRNLRALGKNQRALKVNPRRTGDNPNAKFSWPLRWDDDGRGCPRYASE